MAQVVHLGNDVIARSTMNYVYIYKKVEASDGEENITILQKLDLESSILGRRVVVFVLTSQNSDHAILLQGEFPIGRVQGSP